LADLVYPGALHTRFDHSLGVLFVADLLSKHLSLRSKDRRIIRLSALLHDVGHGPFSHVSEYMLRDSNPGGAFGNEDTEELHERIGINIIKDHSDIPRVLGKETDKVIELLSKVPERTLAKDIISGPMDADKMDYLLRDANFCGVKYGIFDVHQVIDMTVCIKEGGETYLGVKEKGIYAIEQMILAKYHMDRQVYQHKVRCITDAMVIRGLKYAINENCEEIRSLYTIEPQNQEYYKNYLHYDDTTLFSVVIGKGGKWAREYFKRLKERRLLKVLLKMPLEEVPDDLKKNKIVEMETDQKEKEIAGILSIPEQLVVIDKRTEKHPTYKKPGQEIGARIDPNDIMVQMEDGKRRKLTKESKIFTEEIKPEEEVIWVYVAADRISKWKKRKTELANKVKEIILRD
jgi:hypothetical protein